MTGGVYCAECKLESEPGAQYCSTCGRPLRRFSGPRGVEWGPPGGVATSPRRRRWPWILLGVGGALALLLFVLVAVGLAVGKKNILSGVEDITNARSVKLGQSVNAGDWKVTIRRVQNPDKHVTDSQFGGGFTPTPAPGNHFVGATVAVANNTSTVKNAPLGLFFELRDPTGHKYTPTHFDDTFRFGGAAPLGGLDPGASVSGTIAFEVPNTARNLTLYFLPTWPFHTNAVGVAVP